MRTSPPWPPSPPEGPPLGTNFSRRKAMQPFPPSPALMRILASSINIAVVSVLGERSTDGIEDRPSFPFGFHRPSLWGPHGIGWSGRWGNDLSPFGHSEDGIHGVLIAVCDAERNYR